MEQSPSLEADSFSTSQEIPQYEMPQRLCILNRINQVYAFPFYFLKTDFNIIFPSTPRSSALSVSFRFLESPTCLFTLPACIPQQSNPPCLEHRNKIWLQAGERGAFWYSGCNSQC